MEEIIIRQLQGSATDIEAGRLTHWRAESDENERTYVELSKLWRAGGEMRTALRTQDVGRINGRSPVDQDPKSSL